MPGTGGTLPIRRQRLSLHRETRGMLHGTLGGATYLATDTAYIVHLASGTDLRVRMQNEGRHDPRPEGTRSRHASRRVQRGFWCADPGGGKPVDREEKGEPMSRKDQTVDGLLAQEDWHKERKALRAILLDCGLTEAVKWGQLCYTHNDSNVAVIFTMKDTCGIGFFKGSLLKDPDGILVTPGKNTRAARRIDTHGGDDITRLEPVIRAYVAEAVEIEDAGRSVDFEQDRELDYPSELQDALDADPAFAEAFAGLTPGRQRGYILRFKGAKQSATRADRVKRHKDRILQGKGMHDR